MTVFRTLIDGSSSLLGKVKRKQRVPVSVSDAVTKVNLGCGLAVAPDWINVDGSLNALVATMPKCLHRLAYSLTGAQKYYDKPEYLRLLGEHRFVHHDLSYGLPFSDGVADYIYSSHFLEHLFRKDAAFLLEEALRVLKPGGTLRISIPDLEYAVSLYIAGKKDKMLSSYFFVEDDDSYYARHKYMYDYEMLSQLLESVGFDEVRRRAFSQGVTPDIEELDNRAEDSLFVEAHKS